MQTTKLDFMAKPDVKKIISKKTKRINTLVKKIQKEIDEINSISFDFELKSSRD